MGGWSNGAWWVLDPQRTRLYGPAQSMDDCKQWLRDNIGSKVRVKKSGPGVHEYDNGYWIIEEHGYNDFLAEQNTACPDCFLVHQGECL